MTEQIELQRLSPAYGSNFWEVYEVEDQETVEVSGKPFEIAFANIELFVDSQCGVGLRVEAISNILLEYGNLKKRDVITNGVVKVLDSKETPIRIIDVVSREQVLFKNPGEGDEPVAIGAFPTKPAPSLEASVALSIPK